MKKVLYSGAVALIATIAISGCQKDDTTAIQPTQTSQSQNQNIAMGFDPPVLSAAYQEMPIGTNDENWFCEPWPFNCWVLDPIVIHGEQREALSQVADEGPSAVGNLFNSPDYQYICDALPTDVSTKLKSGDYAIQIVADTVGRFDFIANQNRVTKDNYEFVVQLGH